MNKLIVIFLLLSLAGLIYVQVYLLKSGIVLEKTRVDQKVETVFFNLQRTINQNDSLRMGINLLYHQKSLTANPTDSLQAYLKRILDRQVYLELQEEGLVSAGYSFGIKDFYTDSLLLASLDYKETLMGYKKYRTILKGELQTECRCILTFHLHFKQLFEYLLRQLASIIAVSVLFLLLLLSCFSYLFFQMHKLKKLDIVKNDFINNLTHELNTPVFSISLTSKLLRKAVQLNNTPKAEEYIGLIEKENKSLQSHIKKVLELASLENGKYAMTLESIDLNELIMNVAKRFQTSLTTNSLELELNESPLFVKADKVHMSNAIYNLLDNAVKYNSKPVEIILKTSSKRKKGLISVKDNGIGIALLHQNRLFDKFFRISEGNGKAVRGYGLGLSYVKTIVNAHGGGITIDSAPQKGAEFIISLPLEKNTKI
ncbi:MAG: HAMP domain-containing histidine kinase [Bacteroidetes bacterium]|nr:HAMP domain-containing histidine kinase [Bacteroidota bacterium]